ncbi:hypothetical protein AALC17_07000 [Oscillospiraceae bacterium 38-13]
MMNISGKSKKKQLLLAYGLATEEDISQTKRFTEINEVLDYIRIDGSVYIIKLVPIELRPKLKNFIVNDDKSRRSFATDILNYHDYSEIWCCRNECNGEMPIYGRFVTGDLWQTIELIRGNTARLIEKIPEMDSYAVGIRISWGWHYKAVNKGNLPFHDVARWIEEKKNQIGIFFEQLKMIGVETLCVEFKVHNSGLVFTDWDTPDDKTVINRLWR